MLSVYCVLVLLCFMVVVIFSFIIYLFNFLFKIFVNNALH